LAHHKQTRQEVAIKIVTKSETEDDEMFNEISVMAAIDHPNTVKYHEMFLDDDDYYVVLERISGGELFDKIIELSVYEETEAAIAIQQALSAINFMHERDYIHRDLKPENLLLSSKEPDAQIKIADFGFATKIEGEQLSEYLGTPPYMAPELVILYDETVTGTYGKPVDVWALGCILYILLSGLHPFQMDDEDEMIELISSGELEWLGDGWDYVSEGAKDLVTKMLTADTNTRITAKEALEHPWIMEGSKNILNVQDALKRFQLRKRFKGAVFSVMAGNRLRRSMAGRREPRV